MTSHLIPILAIAISIGIFFGFINPRWTVNIRSIQSQIVSADNTLRAVNSYKEKQKDLAAQQESISPDQLERLELMLPDDAKNVVLVRDLYWLAAQSGLNVSGIDVASGAEGGANTVFAAEGVSPLGTVDLSLSATGSYAALQQFLTTIEKSLRLLDVRSITVSGTDTKVYRYTMNIRLYWLR